MNTPIGLLTWETRVLRSNRPALRSRERPQGRTMFLGAGLVEGHRHRLFNPVGRPDTLRISVPEAPKTPASGREGNTVRTRTPQVRECGVLLDSGVMWGERVAGRLVDPAQPD